VTGSAKTEHNSAIHIFQYKALKYIGGKLLCILKEIC